LNQFDINKLIPVAKMFLKNENKIHARNKTYRTIHKQKHTPIKSTDTKTEDNQEKSRLKLRPTGDKTL